MNKIITESIVLSRINYADSDRIITIITKDHGKLRLIAKGSRKIKSKLASGIELFSISEISFIKGRGDISSLISARGMKYYTNIQTNLERVKLAYEILKTIDKYTEDNSGSEYFKLLNKSLSLIDDLNLNLIDINNYFYAQLIKLSGFTPNLFTDNQDEKLDENSRYNFDLIGMNFIKVVNGRFDSIAIKYLRILFSDSPEKIFYILNDKLDLISIHNLIQSMFERHLSV